MGKGLALSFKNDHRWTEEKTLYRSNCLKGLCKPGSVTYFETKDSKSKDPQVLFVFTKDHWQNPSQEIWIEQICNNLIHLNKTVGINNIAIPRIGAGLGGLDYMKQVYPYLSKLGDEVDITLY